MLLHSSQKSNTLAVSSLPPSLHQWKAVRSGQPMRRGPRTLLHPSHPTLEQTTIATSFHHLPGPIRCQVNIRSTRTPPRLMHLPHNLNSRHLNVSASRTQSPESTDRTYRHRKCRTFVVRSTSGAQCAETESPYALHSL